MTKYYKLLLALTLAMTVSVAQAQQKDTQRKTEAIQINGNLAGVKIIDHVFFSCNKSTPVDLFKRLGMYVSPESGYWGDEQGLPLPDKNIFKPVETGKDKDTTYNFYFYVTSPTTYCGTKAGFMYHLELDVHISNCRLNFGSGRDMEFLFCYGTTLEQSSGIDYQTTEIPVNEMVFKKMFASSIEGSKTAMKYFKVDTLDEKSAWLPIKVFADSLYTVELTESDIFYNGNVFTESGNKHLINKTQNHVDTLYLRIEGGVQQNYQVFSTEIVVKLFRQATIELYYNPDILNNTTKEYDIQDNITITVEDATQFAMYKYYLNRKDLSRYAESPDKNEITISALAFSGVEDFIEVVATDTNNCVVKAQQSVIVRVPFPTVFTPDGDGINDVLFGGEKFRNREFHLEVFNRWGNRLYYGESGWDGKYQGRDVPAGTYYYAIRIKLSDGTTREFTNTVTLMRK